MDLDQVRQIEAVAARAWPPLKSEERNGWVLRYSEGVTRRANSVNPVAWAGAGRLARAIGLVEAYYRERALRPRFQISPAALPTDLDAVLAERGYSLTAATAVQTVPLHALPEPTARSGQWRVRNTPAPDPDWLAVYAIAEGASEHSLGIRRAIMAAIADSACYVTAHDDAGRPAAIGSAVAASGYLGTFNVATAPAHRRRGAAQAVMAALAAWGRLREAHTVYLQVMADNAPALGLYAQLGFKTCYQYHYRELP